MDLVKAKELEATLKGKEVAGCMIHSLIDFGKSAAVFRGMRGDEIVAAKIFDNELIEKYGDSAQLARIERELDLIGHNHPNMVQILDGGIDKNTNNHFIVMEFLEGPSLQNCLNDVGDDQVPNLIEQLVSCCEFLEDRSLVHRDIKPANIVLVDDLTKLVLLDFGVLKPVGEVGVTDAGGIQSFVGTLQYSSPEFLLRNEKDTLEGWRALSLYQVGAVLHDLIMRRPIFQAYVDPYARLVNAVQFEQPKVTSKTLPSYLVNACNMALIKDPEKRLELVSWDSFRPPQKISAGEMALRRLTEREALSEVRAEKNDPNSVGEITEFRSTVMEGIKVELRRVRQTYSSIIPPLEILPEADDVCSLAVKIRPTNAEGVVVDTTLFVRVEVIDVGAQAVAISVLAKSPSVEDVTGEAMQVYTGSYLASEIGDRLGEAMLIAVDLIQTGSTGVLDLSALGVA